MANLVCPWRRRPQRKKVQEEKATRPDQRWATDPMHIPEGDRAYFVINFLDEYSRYIAHKEVLPGMDGLRTSLAVERAIEKLPKGTDRKPLVASEIR
jgi:hypothetical protein